MVQIKVPISYRTFYSEFVWFNLVIFFFLLKQPKVVDESPEGHLHTVYRYRKTEKKRKKKNWVEIMVSVSPISVFLKTVSVSPTCPHVRNGVRSVEDHSAGNVPCARLITDSQS